MLLLQAADEGRDAVLFGDSLQQASDAVPPFLVGNTFPNVYLEHPLIGDPFLDVTVLLGKIEPGTIIQSPVAGQHETMLNWYAYARRKNENISCGFEIDTSKQTLPEAAVHFQPRANTELVEPFCKAVGEPQFAELYLDLAQRMPSDWPLSFFGMFRGRPGSPLRVCGYLSDAEAKACAADSSRLVEVFDTIGFSAYNTKMLSQVSALMAQTPRGIDFQFDIFPDKTLGSTFAIDMQFNIEQPEAVQASFENGVGSRIMGLLESWGAADARWKQTAQLTFARALPVELDEGETGRFAFTLMPQWAKARWTQGALQPAKLYHLAGAHVLDTSTTQNERRAV